jgi:hypothetical protein
MFFLTVGHAALRMASPSAGTEVMGFFRLFADARMPIWGISAILSNILLAVLSRSDQRWFYFASLFMLILCVILYNLLSKIQTEAAKTGKRLDNGRELQASWDRVLLIRVPLLVVSLLAQCLVVARRFGVMRLVRFLLRSLVGCSGSKRWNWRCFPLQSRQGRRFRRRQLNHLVVRWDLESGGVGLAGNDALADLRYLAESAVYLG